MVQESEPVLVDVAVNSGQPTRRAFTYSIPTGMQVSPGQPVFVPFGAKILQGIVTGEVVTPPEAGVREIQAIADDTPLLDRPHIELARWMSETYLASLWDCIAVCLPRGYGQKPVTMVAPVDVPPLYPVQPAEQRILQHLGEHGRSTLESLREALGAVPSDRLRRLQEAGYLTVAQGLARPRGSARFERHLRLLRTAEEARERAAELRKTTPRSVDARLLGRLAKTPDLRLAESRELGVTPRHVERLSEEGWIDERSVRVERDPMDAYQFAHKEAVELSPEQQSAVEAVWESGGTHLLHGVTGAGKTEVYMELASRTLAEGRGVIVLVPEISLTPQAIRRYGERFGDTVTVLHSQLGDGELFDTWGRIHEGRARLVLGSRSALFAPVGNLGLIVMDEEHEPSFKQSDPAPRYHARAAAERLAALSGARLVLGSATPDIVTYHRARQGQIGLQTLSQRLAPTGAGGAETSPPPRVEIVDMRDELAAGNRHMFSRRLVEAVSQALRNKEQSILFVNRRGSARFILCRDCGYVAECPTCGVALSLQEDSGTLPKLICHHCGRSRRLDSQCPRCDGARFRPFGVGTQRVEAEAHRAFPNARIARWDGQSASHKGAHEALVGRLERREIDIVVGTQVLAKGLDLPELSVVGAVDADVGLHLPTYQAPERTYQLLSQVVGRAGRRQKQGLGVIQTYSPSATALVAAATGDFDGFYEDELAHRRRAGYPPFARLVRLTYHHGNEDHGLEEASRLAAELRMRRDAAGRADPDILGPSPAYIRRLRGQYRWNILLRGHEPSRLLGEVRVGQRWTVDVDPVNLL